MPEPADTIQPRAYILAVLEKSLASNVMAEAPVCVAFSGGVDSLVLLHALGHCVGSRRIRAVHVNHGLQPESGAWAANCEAIGQALGVPVDVVNARVDLAGGHGLEAAAREARYKALADQLEPGEVLVTAHHQRDQFETLMLRLLRGTGVRGLAAMSAHSLRGGMELLRPMLDVPADMVRAYAVAEQLEWIDDPSNADIAMDRNYLRHRVLPVLLERWGSTETAVTRAARLCGEAVQVLDEIAVEDLAGLLNENRLNLVALSRLSEPRQRNAVRYALRLLGLAIPSEKQLRLALSTLLNARSDTQPEAAWPGVRIRRYKTQLWLYPEAADPLLLSASAEVYAWDPAVFLDMGVVRGTLSFESVEGGGIATEFANKQLQVKFRKGGERLRITPNGRTRELKNLLQERDIIPWMRGHIPLLYAGEELLAVGDMWVNADFAAPAGSSGLLLKWEDHLPVR